MVELKEQDHNNRANHKSHSHNFELEYRCCSTVLYTVLASKSNTNSTSYSLVEDTHM